LNVWDRLSEYGRATLRRKRADGEFDDAVWAIIGPPEER